MGQSVNSILGTDKRLTSNAMNNLNDFFNIHAFDDDSGLLPIRRQAII